MESNYISILQSRYGNFDITSLHANQQLKELSAAVDRTYNNFAEPKAPLKISIRETRIRKVKDRLYS